MPQNKTDLAYQILREKILTGKLQPGVNLDIDELSADFGMSSTSIQKALQRLEADSLVTIELHGAKVTKIHQDVFQEIFELLASLQMITARTACQKMNVFDFTELEAILHRMEGEVNNPEDWSQSETQLHSLLCEKANVPLLKTLLLQVTDHWHRLRRHCLGEAITRRIPVAQQEYRDLLTTLRTRNPDYVTQLMLEHHQHALNDYMAYLNNQDTEQ
jgi:DNA-binding GntR family transcriptional regulator